MNKILQILFTAYLTFSFFTLKSQTLQHKVEKGETLYSIAKKYNIEIDDLIKANPELIEQPVKKGQLLIIPQKNPHESSIKPSLQTQDTTGKNFIIHTVQKGETLYSIAKKYGVSVDQIISENPETANQPLSIGQTLKINLTENNVNKQYGIDSSQFIFHIVKPGETLFSIARNYQVNINEIIKENQNITESDIHPGQTIKIRIDKLIKPAQISADTPGTYFIHVVNKGETLFSISKKFDISIDSIVKYNPGVEYGIKEGQELKIPIKTTLSESSSINLQDNVLDILVICPFELQLNKNSIAQLQSGQNKTIHPKSQVAFDFYLGCLAAIDTLKNTFLPYAVKVAFVDEQPTDSLSFSTNHWTSILKNYDLIIGPFYTENVQKAITQLKGSKIPVIAPMIEDNKLIMEYPYLIKWQSSAAAKMEFMSNYIKTKFGRLPITIVKTSPKDSLLEKIFFSALKNAPGQSLYPNNIYISYNQHKKIDQYLSSTDTNIIVILPGNQVVFTEIINYLAGLALKDKKTLKVITLDNILKFDNLDWDHLNAVNLHIVSSYFISSIDSNLLSIYNTITNKYQIMPNKYTWAGYEIMTTCVIHYSQLLNDPVKITSQLNQRPLLFKSLGIEGGKENFSPFMFEYNHFMLK
ncbi:MAG: hypothetical protein KatS3mg034_0194 [Vicingaceae bacterium]|nr:MAG: hypothetical protein KatS3mg034_0194 [Vicingaceae bacterium]